MKELYCSNNKLLKLNVNNLIKLNNYYLSDNNYLYLISKEKCDEINNVIDDLFN